MEDKQLVAPQEGIVPAKPSQVHVIEHTRELHMHSLTDTELDDFAAGYNSIHLIFFSLCLGALIPFVTTLFSVDLSDRTFAVFVSLTTVSFILAVYFGVRALIDRRRIIRRINKIRGSRQIPQS